MNDGGKMMVRNSLYTQIKIDDDHTTRTAGPDQHTDRAHNGAHAIPKQPSPPARDSENDQGTIIVLNFHISVASIYKFSIDWRT